MDVVVLLWPEHGQSVSRRDAGRPCLFLVAPGSPPPTLVAGMHDWIRMPAEDAEVRTRVAALQDRADRQSRPTLEDDGELVFRGERVFLTPMMTRLARPLVDEFDRVVSSSALAQGAWNATPGAAAFGSAMARLRGRIRSVGLDVRVVPKRGRLMFAN